MAERWSRYKSEYERYLRPETLLEDESVVGEDMEQEETPAAEDSSDALQTLDSEPTVPNGAGDNEEESQPAEEGAPIDEPSLDRTEEEASS
jgi:hypothetical protein